MDVVLQSLDAVNRMFDNVRAGVPPQPADPLIMQQLTKFANPQGPASASAVAPVQTAAPMQQAAVAAQPLPNSPMSPADDFDLLLQESNAVKPAATNAPGNDLITEEEFDSLMDELHGSTGAPGKNTAAAAPVASAPASLEDEFENLLDDLQATGQGAFMANSATGSSPVVSAENVAVPARCHR